MAVDIYSNNSSWREDMPGTGPGQQLRGLSSVLGQVSKKYLLWRTLKKQNILLCIDLAAVIICGLNHF